MEKLIYLLANSIIVERTKKRRKKMDAKKSTKPEKEKIKLELDINHMGVHTFFIRLDENRYDTQNAYKNEVAFWNQAHGKNDKICFKIPFLYPRMYEHVNKVINVRRVNARK